MDSGERGCLVAMVAVLIHVRDQVGVINIIMKESRVTAALHSVILTSGAKAVNLYT